jgi:hypothetical protein
MHFPIFIENFGNHLSFFAVPSLFPLWLSAILIFPLSKFETKVHFQFALP